jgi:hypothetical protein
VEVLSYHIKIDNQDWTANALMGVEKLEDTLSHRRLYHCSIWKRPWHT